MATEISKVLGKLGKRQFLRYLIESIYEGGWWKDHGAVGHYTVWKGSQPLSSLRVDKELYLSSSYRLNLLLSVQ